MWAHDLAIYSYPQVSFNLVAFERQPHVPKLSGAYAINVSNYIQKLPNVNGNDFSKLDSHLALAPINLTAMGVDPETKQSSLIHVFSFTRKVGHWAQQNTGVLYNLNFVSQLLDFVRSSFVAKDYKTRHLQFLIKIE
jgi:hypothetical protein